MNNALLDPFRFAVAITPLAIYFLWIGYIHISKRPKVISGGTDIFYLALGLLGFVAIGPLELFMPEKFAAAFGAIVWVFLILLYLLIAILVILSIKPRVIIYNTTLTQVRSTLSEVLLEIDEGTQWAGNSVSMPNLGIEFSMEANPLLGNISLVASHYQQNIESWFYLHKTVKTAMRVQTSNHRSAYGMGTIGMALLMLFTVSLYCYYNHQEAETAMKHMFRKIDHPKLHDQ